MTNQSTIDKLIEMRLTAMADAFRSQLDDQKLRRFPLRINSVCWWISNTAVAKTISQKTDQECRIRPAGSEYHGYQLYFRTKAKQGTDS